MPPEYTLVSADGASYRSPDRGTVGGHRKGKIFGRLDCPSALRQIARGGYVTQRVFFADNETATAAGYRPCAVCMPDEYRVWKREAVEMGAPVCATRTAD